MYYLMHEMNHAALTPFRAVADATKFAWRNPVNPLSRTPLARSIAAAAELFERSTRRYAKPEFGITETRIDGEPHAIRERTVWSRPFCALKRFERVNAQGEVAGGRKLLIVAPMSGHYATLLRGTVEAMLPHADVYITDWVDARMVPLAQGFFDLDDYIDYVVAMLDHLGADAHVMAVCQPAVPVLAAVSLMEARGSASLPASMTLMGGPIDTRINPTAVNELAESKSIDWFERRVIMQVPWPQPGFLRRVYPGFLQLGGFMSMNLDRHVTAHHEFFEHLVENDGDSAEKHRDFYDEYLAVMDLTAEFYLQTVETVFIEHALPRGTMMHRGERVDPSAIRHTALLTIEGENDDISGVGQTEAAHKLCTNLAAERREHFVQPDVGHYGIFNGSRFRKHIVPRVVGFMDAIEGGEAAARTAAKAGENVVELRPAGKAGTPAKGRASAKPDPAPVDLPGAKAPAARRRRAKAPDPGPTPAPELKAEETRRKAVALKDEGSEPAVTATSPLTSAGAATAPRADAKPVAPKARAGTKRSAAGPTARAGAATEPAAAGSGKVSTARAKTRTGAKADEASGDKSATKPSSKPAQTRPARKAPTKPAAAKPAAPKTVAPKPAGPSRPAPVPAAKAVVSGDAPKAAGGAVAPFILADPSKAAAPSVGAGPISNAARVAKAAAEAAAGATKPSSGTKAAPTKRAGSKGRRARRSGTSRG